MNSADGDRNGYVVDYGLTPDCLELISRGQRLGSGFGGGNGVVFLVGVGVKEVVTALQRDEETKKYLDIVEFNVTRNPFCGCLRLRMGARRSFKSPGRRS